MKKEEPPDTMSEGPCFEWTRKDYPFVKPYAEPLVNPADFESWLSSFPSYVFLLSKPQKIKKHLPVGRCFKVHSEGFEPSTPRAEIWYSIQLNYECIKPNCFQGRKYRRNQLNLISKLRAIRD